MVWVLIALVIAVITLTVLWLYQSNLVTFGLKHSGSIDCTDPVQSTQHLTDGKCPQAN